MREAPAPARWTPLKDPALKLITHAYVLFYIANLGDALYSELNLPPDSDSDMWTYEQYAHVCDRLRLPQSDRPIPLPAHVHTACTPEGDLSQDELDRISDAITDEYDYSVSEIVPVI